MRGAERIYVKDGVMNDGRIVARYARIYCDAGAYSRLSPYGAVKAAAPATRNAGAQSFHGRRTDVQPAGHEEALKRWPEDSEGRIRRRRSSTFPGSGASSDVPFPGTARAP